MQATNHKFAYDGTFEGFLCLAIRCINLRILPSVVKVDYMVKGAIDEPTYQVIRTDTDLAGRFYNYIGGCSCPEVQQMALDCFLTGLPNKERDMIVLISRAIRFGASVAEDYKHDTLHRIQMAICDLYREAQSSLGGMIFAKIDKVDVSMVNPRNSIIPLVKKSILNRNELDDFIVYDKRHKMTFMRSGELNSVMDVSRLPISGDITPQSIYEQMWTYLINSGEFDRRGFTSHKSNDLSPMWYIAV